MSSSVVQSSPPNNLVVKLAFFINIISIGGFMMVVPLGPDLVKSIQLNPAHIGYLIGGTMLGSAIASWCFAGQLDKYDRKSVLIFLLTGRAFALISCGFTDEPYMLIALFSLAGCFTGPASAVLMASVIDVTPPQNRGKVMAFVGSAFSIAAVIMVPFSLQTALYFSWQVNFWLFGVLGLLMALVCWKLFPSLTTHIDKNNSQAKNVVSSLLKQSKVNIALLVVGMQVLAHFLIITNFSSYFQFNLSFPREQLSLLYFIGGISSFIMLQYSGRLFDKGLRHQIHLISAILASVVIFLTYAVPSPIASLYLLFALMMAFSTVRTSVTNGIVSSIPAPPQRAAFMSLNNTVSNLASAAAGILSSYWLTTTADYSLIGMDSIALFSIFLTIAAPVILWRWVNQKQLFSVPLAVPKTQTKEF